MWTWTKNPPTPPAPRIRTDYPFGSCVETEEGWWLIRDKMRFRIPTSRVLDSWSFVVLPSTESAVKHYKKAGVLGFRDGTLIQNVADGRMYIIAANKKRHVVSPDFFKDTGYPEFLKVRVSDEETKLHDDGEVLS